jgi:hypothetical protein
MKLPQPIEATYCALCSKTLTKEQDVFCSDYHENLSRLIKKRECFTMVERVDYLKLNSSSAAYREAIKLINK